MGKASSSAQAQNQEHSEDEEGSSQQSDEYDDEEDSSQQSDDEEQLQVIIPPKLTGQSLPLIDGCVVCNVPTNTQCVKCHMVRYCCKNHQRQHADYHSERCNEYVSAAKTMKNEESKLRRGRYFNEGYIGIFWGVFETRDYMRARFLVIDALDAIATPDATLAALNHCKDCLRLCRGDNLGLRERVPGYLIMLGRYQECYDFLKWYDTTGSDYDYDWSNTDLPFLDLENEDMYEPVVRCSRSVPSYSAMILLKYRILGELLTNRNGFTAFLMGTQVILGAKSPVYKLSGNTGILTHICSYLFVEAAEDPIHVYDIIPPIKKMNKQVLDLVDRADRRNADLFMAILNPKPIIAMAQPGSYGAGSIEEIQVHLKRLVRSWQSVPGALDMIAALRPELARTDFKIDV